MSKYTTQIRFLCESMAGETESSGFADVNNIIQKAIPKIFNFSFPIFDENYRNVLCTKILKHYYTREIGLETVGLWKLKLDAKLNEIMPYYNQLYKSELIKFDPLLDVSYSRTGNVRTVGNGTESGTSNGNENMVGESNNDSTQWNLYSETPQGAITGIENQEYLTNATKRTGEGNTNGTVNTQTTNEFNNENTHNNTEDYVESITGKQGSASYSKLLNEFRNTFLNIDMMVIEELSDLFMYLW